MDRTRKDRGFSAYLLLGVWMWSSVVSAESPSKAQENLQVEPSIERASASVGSLSEGSLETGRGGKVRPPPLNVDYLQSGVGLSFLFALDLGSICPSDASVPCIIGSGGGIAAWAGYRSRGPWYVGGSYSMARVDTSGLMRLGVLQQLFGEMRYLFNLGLRTEPYVTSGLGGVIFGNEWGFDTWGLTSFGGVGFEVQLSRTTVVGMAATYRPILFFEWTDKVDQTRGTGISHFWGLVFTMEARDALGSHGAREW